MNMPDPTMHNSIESIFVSHGAPTFAMEPGAPGLALGNLGQQLIAQGTKALIVLSPHWRSARLEVNIHEAPVIVHDFYGFPKALYELKPEIDGAPTLAEQLIQWLAAQGTECRPNPQQGFDHGAWVPYLHLFPNGGPAMIQLSMPIDLDGPGAHRLGQQIGDFARANKAVVLGSGSLTHNFNDMDLGGRGAAAAVPAYVGEFTAWITAQIQAGQDDAIANAAVQAPHFERAHPDDDHFLPLPFALGASRQGRVVVNLPEDVRYRALSMQSYSFTGA